MVSPGLQITKIKSGGENNTYVRPRVSASGTFNFNRNNSVQVSYQLTNTSPDIAQLNPYNTSTDSVVITRGNPLLTPEMNQSLNLYYEFNKKGFYSKLNLGGSYSSDLILANGFTTPEGVYVNTYENMGKYRQLETYLYLAYNFNMKQGFGQVFGCGAAQRKFYTGFKPLNEFSYYFGANVFYRKFAFLTMIDFHPKTYTDISWTLNKKPTAATFQVSYSISQNLTVSACLEGFTGNLHSVTHINNGSYHSVLSTIGKRTGFMPWIMIRWNMRKNMKQKINLENVLKSTEEGIKLVK